MGAVNVPDSSLIKTHCFTRRSFALAWSWSCSPRFAALALPLPKSNLTCQQSKESCEIKRRQSTLRRPHFLAENGRLSGCIWLHLKDRYAFWKHFFNQDENIAFG